MIDRGTFGNTEGARVLIDILNKRNDLKLTKSVCSLLSSHSRGLHEIKNVKHPSIKVNLMNYWTKQHREGSKKYDTEVGNFTRCVISSTHKKIVKSL